jgi:hypothetical protein
MDIWTIVGALGVGLVAGGVVGVSGRQKYRRLAAIAPGWLVLGICLLGVKFYGDYEKARTPLSPEKALESATKTLIKRLPKSD